jgi:signal peptidase II
MRIRELTRLSLVVVILVTCVGCDQVSKHLVRANLDVGYTRSFFGDTLRLTHAENPGAFLSLGADLPRSVRVGVFQAGVAILVVGLILFALSSRELNVWSVGAVALLAASGLGNLLDRLYQNGSVTDFINLGIGSLRTGIFNIADVVGLIGVALLLLQPRRAPPNNSLERSRDR